MNPIRLLLGAVVRAVALVAVTGTAIVAVDRSDSSDALGAGLTVFFVLVAIAFAWSMVDGIRRGLVAPLVTWVLVGVLAGVGIPVLFALVGDGDSVADEIADSASFFGLLLLVPAVAGCCLGGLVHRLSRPSAAA